MRSEDRKFARRGGMVLVLLVAGACGACNRLGDPPIDDPSAEYELGGQRFSVETVTSGLAVPWSIDFTPDGEMLIIERAGRLKVIDPDSGDVKHNFGIDTFSLVAAEAGLMGLAVSPDFANDRLLYVSLTSPSGPAADNSIRRMTFRDGALTDAGVVLADIPAAVIHDGLPIRFGPDGKLYAATGDAANAGSSQNAATLAGKFLRMNADGGVPDDNPFVGSRVWTLGHRNPQGFDFDPLRPGEIVATEHGQTAGDELNRIVAGRNYGWPELERDEAAAGFEPPLLHSGDESFAPAGATFVRGDTFPAWKNALLFVGLRGQSLWVVKFDATTGSIVSIERGLQATFGRLRSIREGPDGLIYIGTSNRDSRGVPGASDDRILRLRPL